MYLKTVLAIATVASSFAVADPAGSPDGILLQGDARILLKLTPMQAQHSPTPYHPLVHVEEKRDPAITPYHPGIDVEEKRDPAITLYRPLVEVEEVGVE